MMNAKSATLSGWSSAVCQAVHTATGSTAADGLPLYWIGHKIQSAETPVNTNRFGPEHEITRYLMGDTGVQLAMVEYRRQGFSDLTGDGVYIYTPHKLTSLELMRTLLFDRMAGAFLDGYTVEIRNLGGSSNRCKLVEITVSADLSRDNLAGRSRRESGKGNVAYSWIEEICPDGSQT